MIRYLIIFFAIVCYRPPVPASGSTTFIDPTGTYILKGVVSKNVIKGHFGELRVKLLTNTRTAICFYLNSGYPDYRVGSFLDTLLYDEDHLQYNPTGAGDCLLYFYFKPQSAELQQSYSDPNSSCGFARGVIISTVFNKYSDDKPVIQDLSTHGIIP
jgi:hypothetical protein